MITLADYWMGRDRSHAADLTDAIRENATLLLGRINLVLSWAYRDGVQPTLDPVTGTHIAGGWRPPSINEATANAGKLSTHLLGNGGDLSDRGPRLLAQWLIRHPDSLREAHLWMERPQWTPTWCHLQQIPPRSGKRYYIPSTRPPLAAALPGELESV